MWGIMVEYRVIQWCIGRSGDNWINVLTVSSVWCSMVIINNIDDMGKTIINVNNDFFIHNLLWFFFYLEPAHCFM